METLLMPRDISFACLVAVFCLGMIAMFLLMVFDPRITAFGDWLLEPANTGSPVTNPPTEKAHSGISLASIVDHKLKRPDRAPFIPIVEEMTYVFDEPKHDDDHAVRLYLALSQEERGIVQRYGLSEKPFDTENLFGDEELEQLRHEQEKELASTSDPHLRASLRIEHDQQLKEAKERKLDITLEHLLLYPFVREFKSRGKATEYQNVLEAKLGKLKQTLEASRAK